MRLKKYVINSITSIVLYIITIIIGLIIPRLIISVFSSETNGLVTSIAQFLSYITIAQAGIGAVSRSALYRPLAEKNTSDIRSVVASTESFFKKVALVFIVYLIVLISIYPLFIKKDYNWLYTGSLILIISFSTFADYFFGISYSVLLQADQAVFISNIIQIAVYILNFSVTYMMIKIGASIHAVKLCSAFVLCLKPIITRYFACKRYKIISGIKVPKMVLSQKWDALGQHIAYYLFSNTDIVVLTFFSSLKEISVYSVYNSVVLGLNNLISNSMSGLESVYGDMLARKEHSNLILTLRRFELLLSFIVVVIFSSANIMFIPFVKIYTAGITDVNYVRYDLALAMVIAGAIYCIRLPYAWLVTAVGHFKQTQMVAYAEAAINILLSLVLIKPLGSVGLVIATIIATLMRTIYLAIYVSKKIVKRSMLIFIKRQIITLLNVAAISLIKELLLSKLSPPSLFVWAKWASCVFIIAMIITIIFNFMFYNSEFIDLFNYLKKHMKSYLSYSITKQCIRN